MFKNNQKIILASKSPRRIEFFKMLGIDVEVFSASIDEEQYRNLEPPKMVQVLSLEKAKVSQEKYFKENNLNIENSDIWFIGADTDVVFNGKSLGKPKDKQDAEMRVNAHFTKIKILCRIVTSTKGDDTNFATNLTKYTNSQNDVKVFDFCANRPEQIEIQKKIAAQYEKVISKYEEHKKSGMKIIRIDAALDIQTISEKIWNSLILN